MMAVKRSSFACGVTLIEVMLAIVMVAMIVLGASGYRYYALLDVRKAEMRNNAATIALLFCENWRGRGFNAAATFEPWDSLGSALIEEADIGKKKYTININGVRYYTALAWLELGEELKALNVTVRWAQRQRLEDGGPPAPDKSFYLTTFVAEN